MFQPNMFPVNMFVISLFTLVVNFKTHFIPGSIIYMYVRMLETKDNAVFSLVMTHVPWR